jgi:hypothetical protein
MNHSEKEIGRMLEQIRPLGYLNKKNIFKE